MVMSSALYSRSGYLMEKISEWIKRIEKIRSPKRIMIKMDCFEVMDTFICRILKALIAMIRFMVRYRIRLY